MAKYSFLSDEWVAEARRIYSEATAEGALLGSGPLTPVRVNLVVTEVPFSEAPLHAHVDTSGGNVIIETGHLEGPDVTVSMDYLTARSLFVSGDAQAVMQAFLSGRLKVDGDLSKLLDPKSGLWPASSPLGAPSPGLSSPGTAAGGPGGGGSTAGGSTAGGPAAGRSASGGSASGGSASEGTAAGRPATQLPFTASDEPSPQQLAARRLSARLQEITE